MCIRDSLHLVGILLHETVTENTQRPGIGAELLHDQVVVLTRFDIGAVFTHRMADGLEFFFVLILDRLYPGECLAAPFHGEFRKCVAGPRGRRRAEDAKLLERLKKNRPLLTAGGIYGTVVNVQKGSDDVTLKIDENNNVRIRVLRTAITRVVSAAEGDQTASTSE